MLIVTKAMESEEEEGSQWSPGPAAVAAIEGEEYLAARRLQLVMMMIMTIILYMHYYPIYPYR
jgi:hypothetical protein